MQGSYTTKLLLILLIVGLGGAIAFNVLLLGEFNETSDEIHRLEERVEGLEQLGRDSAKAAREGAEAAGPMERRLEDLDDHLSSLGLKLRANGKRLDALEAGDLGDLGIDELIDQKLVETINKARYGPLGKAPDVEKLGDYLELTERQKQRITSLLDESKERVYDIMAREMGDDGNMMDRMLETMNGSGDREQKTKKILSDLFETTVPGTDESYFTTLMDIRTKAMSDFQGTLTGEQLKNFEGSGAKIFGIRTGYHPFSEELQQVLSGVQ